MKLWILYLINFVQGYIGKATMILGGPFWPDEYL